MENEQQAVTETPINDIDMGNLLAPDNFTVDKELEKPQDVESSDPEQHQQDNADESAQEQPENQDSETQEQSEDAPEPQKEADFFEVTVSDGTTQKVTIDDLKKGYLMQSDYTKKTTELAKEREKLQESFTQLETHFLQVAENLLQEFTPVENLRSHRESLVRAANDAREIGDLEEFNAKRLDIMEIDEHIKNVEYKVNTLSQASKHQTERMTTQQLAKEREKLFAALPELEKPEKQKEFQEATYKALEKAGYTQEEMQSMGANVDARQAQLAYYAGLYLSMQGKAPEMAKAIQDKIVSPRVNPSRQQSGYKILDKLKQDPNNELAIGALLAPQ